MRTKLTVVKITTTDKATKKGPEKLGTAILQGGSEILKVTVTIQGRPDRVREELEKLNAYYIGGEAVLNLIKPEEEVKE